MDTGIIGHEKVMQWFDTLIERGKLSHAYCFSGLEHIGKHTVAESIAARLLGTTREKLALSPDFHLLERETDEKTGALKKDLIIKQVRDLSSVMKLSAFARGGYRVGIIDTAEYLNPSSASAFLKTLEEPGEKTVFFLLVSDISRVLSTVRSRCQTLYFRKAPREALAAYAIGQGETSEKAARMAEYANGLPGRMISWIKNPLEFEAYCAEAERFAALFGAPLYKKTASIEELFGDKSDKKDHTRARGRLREVLAVWLSALHSHIGGRTRLSGLENAEIAPLDRRIREARAELEKNIHPRLLVEHILLSIP